MRLVISRSARSDIREIVGVIRRSRPKAAARWRSDVLSRLDVLRKWPLSGRIVTELEEPSIRELIVGNFRLLYQVRTSEVVVLAVIDARRDLGSLVREPVAEYNVRPSNAAL